MTTATTGERAPSCTLCETDGGEPVWRNGRARVVLVEHARFPGFCRVIWNDHVAEQTDLSDADRHWLMEVVARVERVLRTELAPDKVNLASFGNFVPHMHWHVIPRYRWDTHFPEAVWGPEQRAPDTARMAEITAKLPALSYALQAALADV
ncbi:HIT family protein [Ralstonia sp. 1138]|uniref:HIT family protein n=1 Tax=Ralstonia sp. 1138 TaxID=3156423 RepID=UPI003394441D